MVNFKRVDIIGKKFNNLVVVDYGENYVQGNYKLLCRCDCGNLKEIARSSVTSGLSKSCGCLLRKHGMRYTRFYSCWTGVKNRCKKDKLYTSQGISYDPRWEEFTNFYADMYDGYSDGLELDRIDPKGNYFKENCMWVTESYQAYNQGIRKCNTSGRTGVFYLPKRNKWKAEITHNGARIHLYQGDSYEIACKYREEAELKYFGKIKE